MHRPIKDGDVIFVTYVCFVSHHGGFLHAPTSWNWNTNYNTLVVYFAAGNLKLNFMSTKGQIFCIYKHLREKNAIYVKICP